MYHERTIPEQTLCAWAQNLPRLFCADCRAGDSQGDRSRCDSRQPNGLFGSVYVSLSLLMLGRFLGGTLSDYLGRESVYSIFMCSSALAIVILLYLTPGHAWMLYGYVVLIGLGMGVGGAMFPPMMADLFPGPSLGKIMGVSSIPAALGAGLGSWFAGYSYDITGNYTAAWVCILLTIFGAIVSVWIAAPRKALKGID